ncbi:protein of unknown function [Winogradskyella sediminis]|uniref:DUF5689 domain-containing protein n=2 Tax=Winogradskyella sediminis TaxID=1382466 RepID=A0A1H1RCJ8_9FLAO|nr:protein of unknown function [Winogradskyella sediminis]
MKCETFMSSIIINKNVMNKTIKSLKLILILMASFAITSCVEDDDYTIPTNLGDEENYALQELLDTATEVSFDYAKALYNSDPNGDGDNDDAIPYLVENDIYIKGYVSSSDRTGNFYKELYIQNSAENPTSAMKIILDQVSNYNQFNKGREVYIKLTDLYIGEERTGSGIYTIGGEPEFDQFGGTVTSLNFNEIAENMLRSGTTEEIVPLNLTFSEITDDHVGMFIQVDNVEFADNLNGLQYFDPSEVYDTARTLQSCSGFGYDTFILETSSFADFKAYDLPTGNGSIKAVLSKTFDASSFVLALNSVDDVDMDGARCSLLDIEDFETLLEEDFESMPTGSSISSNGWTSYAEVGTYNWRALTTTDSGNPGPGNIIASMGAYNSSTDENIAWLISPSIDLEAQGIEFLNFQSSNSFSDDSELEVLISTDWDGTQANVTSATWTTLPAIIAGDDEFYQDWFDSGLINLSSYSGTAYIAFKYIGGFPSSENIDGTFEIDNFKILGEN